MLLSMEVEYCQQETSVVKSFKLYDYFLAIEIAIDMHVKLTASRGILMVGSAEG